MRRRRFRSKKILISDADADEENVEQRNVSVVLQVSGHGLRGEAKDAAQTSRFSSKPVSQRQSSPSRRPLSFNQHNVLSRSSVLIVSKRHRSQDDADRRDNTTDKCASDGAIPCRPCPTFGRMSHLIVDIGR